MLRGFLLLSLLVLVASSAAAQTRPARTAWTAGNARFAPLLSADENANGTSRRGWLETGAVGLTGAGHLGFSALDQSRLFIPIATLGWGAYVIYRARTDGAFLGHVGLTSANLGGAFRDATLVALGASALMAGLGARQGPLYFGRDLLPLFLLYPIWGVVQQLLVQGMVAANLSDAPSRLGSPYVVTPVAATLFGAVHVPNWKLTAATFALGLAFTPLYFKHRNVWPLGLYHGWLGALFYVWVLDRNPWRDIVRKGQRPHDQKVRIGLGVGAEGRPALHLRLRL